MIVGVPRREFEDELGRDSQARHTRVVDRTPELVLACGTGQGGARLVEHPRQPGIPLELLSEATRLLRFHVDPSGRSWAATRRCRTAVAASVSPSKNRASTSS